MANVDANILLCEWINPTNFFLKHSDSNKQFSETDRINMLEYWTTNLLRFGGRIFPQTSGRYHEPADQNLFALHKARFMVFNVTFVVLH
jgi:3-methyladenine DNA glycosylase Mpg